MFNPQTPTGKHRVQDKATGLYLVAPISGWREHNDIPAWTDIPEAAFGFRKSQAQDNVNFLGWNHKVQAKVV